MGTRVVLDTNILLSCLDHRHQLLLSPDLLEEVERVLRYPKFHFSSAEILDFLVTLTEAAELVRPGFKVEVIEADPSDNRVLECALAGRAQVIVSGDGHLLSLEGFEIP